MILKNVVHCFLYSLITKQAHTAENINQDPKTDLNYHTFKLSDFKMQKLDVVQ